ncbi:PREDICTED: uncharacterized protein LOC105456920 [Wasmannia auropunctata]|uniref:uncharacterized protein LOC105456920 n=1 Tax=Wasmannia auropunctata TaxID=64793 RepID=UPI0005EDD7E6|nr:PREDICTED: uncharacterized protein LOC105456920 [Wasmannia auropunctata]
MCHILQITSGSESSDDDALLSHMITQSSKYDVETLKADNRTLKLENRKLKEVTEDMKEIKNIMKDIRDCVMKIEKRIEKLAGISDTNKQENANGPIDNILFDGTLSSVYIDPPLQPETCSANGENVMVVIPLDNTVKTVKPNNNNPCQPLIKSEINVS